MDFYKNLTGKDWAALIPFGIACAAVGYSAKCCIDKHLQGSCTSGGRCNNKVKLDSKKVVDSFDMEDLDKQVAFCRCWKSSKFPYCDGSHNKHNESTGDNVGPLVLNKKA